MSNQRPKFTFEVFLGMILILAAVQAFACFVWWVWSDNLFCLKIAMTDLAIIHTINFFARR